MHSISNFQFSSPHQRMQPTSNIDRAYTFASLSSYSLKDRLLIRAADLVFFLLIKLIGRTIKFEIEGWDNWEAASCDGKIPIYTFWHNRVFLATYFWRCRRIVVMTSRSFDGEYIARFIQRFGYGAARGSSTRGATGAVVEMVRLMRAGCPTAFTEDGQSDSAIHDYGAEVLGSKEELGWFSDAEAIYASASDHRAADLRSV
ncbi:MAG: hypothetical protein DMF75_09140 [Acidobacteria bacterium]|nr:MAG: hypothetical protein DMF75_09140 [Acidobacteriota bacterium]